MKNQTTIDLRDYCNYIKKEEILLPDFQRNFTWKDLEKQKMLISSVLAKLPVGNILLLSGNSNDYKSKKLGIKPKASSHQVDNDKNVDYLIDGQQRMTVLINTFSHNIFLQNVQESYVENSLKYRWFLSLIVDDKADIDIFGLNVFKFPFCDPENMVPSFSSNELLDFIYYLKNDYMDILYPKDYSSVERNYIDFEKIKDFCTLQVPSHISNGIPTFLIPLFTLCDDVMNQKGFMHQSVINKILEKAIDKRKEMYIQSYEYDVGINEFTTSIKPLNSMQIDQLNSIEDIQEKKNRYSEMINELANDWKNHFLHYINSCITKMSMAQIVVPSGQRSRAINIYEMLNKGGVSLSMYDLIIATVAKKIDDQKSFDTCIREELSHIIELPTYDSTSQMFKDLNWNANEYMEIINKDDIINSKFINIFLNLLSLSVHIKKSDLVNGKFDINTITIDLVKRDCIMKLTPDEILSNYQSCVKGITRALYILQTRCGLINIKSINYDHVLLILSYFFKDDDIYNDEHKMEYLCGWYWLVNFSGDFNDSQTEKMKKNLINLIKHFYLNEDMNDSALTLLDSVFNKTGFDSKDFLLMENPNYDSPKTFLRTLIAQFIIRNGKCRDLVRHNVKLQAWNKNLKLEEHHIIPLGSATSYNDSAQIIRRNKKHSLNSPVNFMYLTHESNNAISNNPIDVYLKRIFINSSDDNTNMILQENALKHLSLAMNFDEDPEEFLDDQKTKDLLKVRFDDIQTLVKTYIKEVMNI